MDYDADLLGGNESSMATNQQIYLGWLNPVGETWENAVAGSFGTNSGSSILGHGPPAT